LLEEFEELSTNLNIIFMLRLKIYLFLMISTFSFGQSQIATTEKGKKVLLKVDNTWEYLDSPISDTKKKSQKECHLGDLTQQQMI